MRTKAFTDTERIIKLGKEIQEELIKEFHPHTSVIIDFDGIRVEETIIGVPTSGADKDNVL